MTIPQAIIFDLDGTLAESKSPLMRDMGALLVRLMAHMPVAVMSGGSYLQFQKQLLAGFPANADFSNLYLFPTSAAQCYAWRDGLWQFLYSNSFTKEERVLIQTALAESLHETGLDVPPPQLWGEQTEDRGAQITWSALGQQAPIEVKKAWDPDRSKRIPLQAALIARLPGFSVRVNATSSIDITREGITKAYGVEQFSDIIRTPISELLYVGDALFPGGNDEVVKESGVATQQVTGPAETAQLIEKLLSEF